MVNDGPRFIYIFLVSKCSHRTPVDCNISKHCEITVKRTKQNDDKGGL